MKTPFEAPPGKNLFLSASRWAGFQKNIIKSVFIHNLKHCKSFYLIFETMVHEWEDKLDLILM